MIAWCIRDKDNKDRFITANESKEIILSTLICMPEYTVEDVFQAEVEKGYDGAWYLTGKLPREPKEQLSVKRREERDNKINEISWRIDRFEQQEKLGIETTENVKVYVNLLKYVQYLRDIPAQPEFPYSEILDFETFITIN